MQLARDRQLIAAVNRWDVMTRELGTACLGLPRTPTNLKIVEKRYRSLAKAEFNRFTLNGVTFNISLKIPNSKLEHAQLEHKFMGAWSGSTLIRALNIEDFFTERQLRARDMKYVMNIIPDGFFPLKDGEALFWENETGKSDIYDVFKKCDRYFEQYKLLHKEYEIEYFFVVWNCKDKTWVERIANYIRTKMPEEAWPFFLVCSEANIDPFHPLSILDKIYLCPVHMQYIGMLKD